jgi:hypothetical protein
VPTAREKPLTKGLRGRKGVIAEQLYDPRQKPNSRYLLVIFPPTDGELINVKFCRNIFLAQAQLVSSLFEVIPDRLRLGRVGLGFGGFQRYFAVWQKVHASMRVHYVDILVSIYK